jgi:hypothetical protein
MKFVSPLYKTLSIIVFSIAVLAAVSCSTPPPVVENTSTATNHPPVIAQISGPITWEAHVEGQFICEASDKDGDKLTYAWSLGGTPISGSGSTLNWTAPSQMGKYRIEVVVSDGKGGEARSYKDISIGVNEDGSVTLDPPVQLKFTFSQTDNVTTAKRVKIWTSSPVECIVSGIDPKTVKYSWTTTNGRIQGKGLNEGTADKVVWIAPGIAGDFSLDVVATDSRGNQSKGSVTFTVFCCGNY